MGSRKPTRCVDDPTDRLELLVQSRPRFARLTAQRCGRRSLQTVYRSSADRDYRVISFAIACRAGRSADICPWIASDRCSTEAAVPRCSRSCGQGGGAGMPVAADSNSRPPDRQDRSLPGQRSPRTRTPAGRAARSDAEFHRMVPGLDAADSGSHSGDRRTLCPSGTAVQPFRTRFAPVSD